MRYWPLSLIAQSPLLHHTQAWELKCAYHVPGLSQGTLMACSEAAGRTQPVETPLMIVHSVGAPMRRVYTEYPEFDDWLRLERGGFIATDDTFGFVIDALH